MTAGNTLTMASATAFERGSRTVVLGAMCTGYFLVLLDVTIVNVALPQIRAGLDASVSALQWVVDGYAIALASAMLAAGTLGDIRGHRRIVVSGLALFGLASLGGGLAPGPAALVGARVVQGFGAALLLPGTLAIIADAFPRSDERARAIGIWASLGSVALPAGPLLGGLLTQSFGWRSVFIVNVPIVAATIALTLRVAPEGRGRSERHVDVPGTALGACSLALLIFAIVHGGLGPVVVAALLGCVACLLAFVWAERRSPDPVMPLEFFKRRSFAIANGVAATMNLCTLGLLFVVTLYLQGERGRSPLQAGVELLPLFLPLVFVAPWSGRITGRRGPAGPMTCGLILAAAGFLLLALNGPATGYGSLLPALLLWGVGLGLLTPAVVAASIAAVSDERSGLASGVNNTARQAGGAVGIAIFGTLGLHAAGLLAAALYTVAALVASTYRSPSAGRRASP